MSGTQVDQIESMLGRRLRPWWGQAPSRLVTGGAVAGAIFCGVIYASFQVRGGDLDLTGTGLEERRSTIDSVALGAAALAALGILYNGARLVVGAIDLVVRRTIKGTVVSVRERRTGDFLPWYVQRLWYSRRDESGYTREMGRRSRTELVLESSGRNNSWNVRPNLASESLEGTSVEMTVTPMLGFVRRIERVGPVPTAPVPEAPSPG
ncbi:MAG: hypothetical protein WBA45_11080 [Microthrixaceae bacterium]